MQIEVNQDSQLLLTWVFKPVVFRQGNEFMSVRMSDEGFEIDYKSGRKDYEITLSDGVIKVMGETWWKDGSDHIIERSGYNVIRWSGNNKADFEKFMKGTGVGYEIDRNEVYLSDKSLFPENKGVCIIGCFFVKKGTQLVSVFPQIRLEDHFEFKP